MVVARSHINYFLTAFAGGTVWLTVALIAEKREPWDSEIFWMYGVPSMVLLNFFSSLYEPRRIIERGLVSVSLQPVIMSVMAGEIGSLFPLGLIVFVFLGILYSAGGAAGKFVRVQFFSKP